jgi:hypothetical protein
MNQVYAGVTSRRTNTSIISADKIKKIGIPAIILIVIIAIGARLSTRKSTPTATQVNNEVTTTGPIVKSDINRDFTIPLKDTEGEEVGQLKYTIESAELRNQILVKGAPATAIPGRLFLILNVKIVNDNNQSLKIKTRDYLRLSVNGNLDEWLAPDIHNDPVEVQGISTKYTRIGFPVNDTDNNFVLRAGEITGDKQDIAFNLDR